MKKNLKRRILTDISLNSINPHNSYYQSESLNNTFYKTTNNFRTNLYNKEFKKIKVNNSRNNLSHTLNSFNEQKIAKIQEIKKMTQEQIINYIIYLKNNLNSSYYANNELNIEYNKLLKKMRQINQIIINNNEKYNKMNNTYKENLQKNKKNKDTYINMIDQYQLYNETGVNKNNDLNKKINAQENEIIKLINEKNKLTDDINNKKILIQQLQNMVKLENYKQEFVHLEEKKNGLILNLENIKKLKEIKNKSEELQLNMDKIKNELSNKEKEETELIKIKEELVNKIKILSDKNDSLSNELLKNSNSNENNNTIILNREIIPLNNDTIQHYHQLIKEEKDKNFEINKKLETKKRELEKIKDNINTLKIKNEEEITYLNKYIKLLDSNNEKIKEEIEIRKKGYLDQRQILLKYNKTFKESLLYKKDLMTKIEAIKKENETLKNRQNKVLNIKTIKSRKNVDEYKYNNNIIVERNLSYPNLVQHKKSNNKGIKVKSLSFEKIYKNKINANLASTPRSGKYIYTIDKKGNLLSYNIDLKKFVYINTSYIKGWKSFYSIYNKNSTGSLFLNTLSGLFIITGDNYNQLFYYSQNKNMINLIKLFKSNHKYGGMLLIKDTFTIILLGGECTKSVILFDLKKNEVINLPDLIYKRIDSCFNIINDRYILSFFGKGNNTIEFFDLNNVKNNWNILNYKSNSNIFSELYGHIGFNIDNNVIIIGGKNNDNITIFYFREKFLDITDIKLKDNSNIKELCFDKEKCFNIIEEKNKKDIIGMDNEGNVHCFNDDYAYSISVF